MSRRYDDSGDRSFDFGDEYEDISSGRSRFHFENSSYDYGSDKEDINLYSRSSSHLGGDSQDDYEYYEDYDDYEEDYEEDYEYDDGYDTIKRSPSPARKKSRGHNPSKSTARSRNYREKPQKSKGKSTKFICSVLAVLLIVFSGAAALCYYVIKDVDYKECDYYTFESVTDQEFSTVSSDSLYSKLYVKNIMLFGVDDDSSENGRSDTMMLLSIDNKHHKLKLTSFQRDTFVLCPDPDEIYHTKLTNTFSYGGVPLTIATIEANYGVDIDAYATVNFETFKTIVDILGGVTIELTEDEIGYINGQIYDNGQSEENYIDAPAGPVTLNGDQALWYARNRGGTYGGVTYSGDDWDRTDRQRKFLEAVLDSMKSANIFELYSIIKSVTPNVTTDLKKPELTLMALMSPLYLTYEMAETSMPTDDNWVYDENFAGDVIYVTNWQQVRDDLKTFVYD